MGLESSVTSDEPGSSRKTSARVVIAGVGLITPLGHSAWATFNALREGRMLADRAARLPDPVDAVSLVRALGAVSVAQHVPRDATVELAERAAREAAFAGGVDPGRVPLWLGTSKGAIGALTEAADLIRHERFKNPEAVASDAWLAGALGPHQYLATQLARRLGSDMRPHHVAACASSLTAMHHAAEHLRRPPCHTIPRRRQDHAIADHQSNGRAEPSDSALVVTADAALLPTLIHSYRRLGVLSELTPAGYRQKPLDENRAGFMLSEAGAAVLLKRLPAGTSPQPGEIELVDTALASEAYDMIRPSPDMAGLSHVAKRLMTGRSIDMIHPHAPGTREHDPTELAIYRTALGPCRSAPPGEATVQRDGKAGGVTARADTSTQRATRDKAAAQVDVDEAMADGASPGLYACKGAIGHSLGAAGLSALVLATRCLMLGQRPPMPWLSEPIDQGERLLQPAAAGQRCARCGTHAIFASGFGGHTAGAVIQRH